MRARRSVAALSVLVVCLVGCTGDPPPRIVDPPAQAVPPPSPTPDTEELIRQTQAAYQIAFDEYERLSWEGGADEPSAKMLEVEHGDHLEQVMALLKYQKTSGFRLEGEPATTKFRAATGAMKGNSDPRMTLQVCEDRRRAAAIYPDGRSERVWLVQGYVYASLIGGRAKLVDFDTQEVERCTW